MTLDYGDLTLRRLTIPLTGSLNVQVNQEPIGAAVSASDGTTTVEFTEPLELAAGDEIQIVAT